MHKHMKDTSKKMMKEMSKFMADRTKVKVLMNDERLESLVEAYCATPANRKAAYDGMLRFQWNSKVNDQVVILHIKFSFTELLIEREVEVEEVEIPTTTQEAPTNEQTTLV